MAGNDPYQQGPFSQAGKPARMSPYDPIRAAYAQQQPMRPTPGALNAYGPPTRQRPMGYGFGMASPRGAYGHAEPDPDQWGGPSDMDADNGYGPMRRRPRLGGVSPSNPFANGGGY